LEPVCDQLRAGSSYFDITSHTVVMTIVPRLESITIETAERIELLFVTEVTFGIPRMCYKGILIT